MEVDNELDRLIQDKQEIPRTVQQIQNDIQTLKQEIDTTQNKLAKAQQNQNEIKEFIREKNEWIARREATINEIKTNKEYQAALKEIATAKKAIKEKEEGLKSLEPRLKELTESAETTRQKNEPKIQELKNTIAAYKERFDKIDAGVSEHKEKRNQVIKEIKKPAALRHYEQVHKRVSPALASIEHGACGECGTRILPQVLNLVRICETLQYCSRCKRILYLEEVLSEEPA